MPTSERVQIEHLGANFHRVVVRYASWSGRTWPPRSAPVSWARRSRPSMDTSLFLSRETFLPSARPDLPRWRERIFVHMANAALDATRFFRPPPNRVAEISTQVEI